jgi:F-type H+-transporting ATPase subunit b
LESLGINLYVLIAQIVNIVILFFVLRSLLFNRFLEMMEERKQRIQEGLEKADSAQERAWEAERVYQERMEEIEREREAIISEAKEEAEQLQAEMLSQAREEAEEEARRIVAERRAAFEAERREMMADMRNQMASLVMAATRKVVDEGMDEEVQHRLIDRFLSETDALGEIQ